MKKQIKRMGLVVAVALVFALLVGCSSQGNPYDYYPDYEYRITHLSVQIDASKGDRSMRIIEKYTFEFDTYSQGFYRDFAVNSGEKIRDLTVYDFSQFGNTYKVSHEDTDVLRVRVGKEGHYIRGSGYECTIEYTMVTPPHADYPHALAVNAIGQGWSCEIESADITVRLPQATNQTPRYYYGGWGSIADAVTDNMVSVKPAAGSTEYSFSLNKPLSAYEGLTLYYFMPEGAFRSYSDNTVWFVLLAGIVAVGIAIALKFLMGRSPALAPTTNYYPPKHTDAKSDDLPMDPVDMGYLIDNTCQGSDVTSLIFYFAGKGYLEILDEEDSDNFTLKKVCELPEGLPSYQYVLFDKIFSRGDTATVSQLTNRTYTAVQTTQSQIRGKYAGKLYDGKSRIAAVAVGILTVLYAFLTVFLVSRKVCSSYFTPVGVVALFPVVLTALFGSYIVYNRLKLGSVKRIFLLTAFALAVAAFSCLLGLLIAVTGTGAIGTAEVVVTVSVVAVNCLIIPFIARRTKYYTDELNEVIGFKDFLVTAEKEKLEALLEENPQYYYDILPYANVLGVSDIWQDKFEGLTFSPPSYYNGSTVFTYVMFNRMYRHSYRAYSTATVSRPSSSSSSGGRRSFGGGGGRSGGGFGGGGGGRW